MAGVLELLRYFNTTVFMQGRFVILCVAVLLGSCRAPRAGERNLTVAAAANLMEVFGEAGRAFQVKTGVEMIFSYGSTAQLATQIDNGAPFDLFAAADTEHVD